MYKKPRQAFTLVEILVVITVIGILAGSLVAVLRTGERGPALQAAQATLSGLVSSARAQAALGNTKATLVIWADPSDPETYLRRAAIAVGVDMDNNGTADFYSIQSETQDLPVGIFFVPENSTENLPAKLEVKVDWEDMTMTESQATNHGTTLSTSAAKGFKRFDFSASPQWQDDPDAPNIYYESIAFDSLGKLAVSEVNYIAVAPGEIQAGVSASEKGVLFKNADSVLGIKLSAYGIPILLTEKNAFK